MFLGFVCHKVARNIHIILTNHVDHAKRIVYNFCKSQSQRGIHGSQLGKKDTERERHTHSTKVNNCVIISQICNLFVSITFLSMTELLSPAGTFYVYALFSIVFWIFVIRWVPEASMRCHIALTMWWRSLTDMIKDW